MADYCDENEDGVVSDCELHACLVMTENEWRNEYCAGYPHVHCDCPFNCEDALSCDHTTFIVDEAFAALDSDMNGWINMNDAAYMELECNALVEACDFDNDGAVTKCELYECIIYSENLRRDD